MLTVKLHLIPLIQLIPLIYFSSENKPFIILGNNLTAKLNERFKLLSIVKSEGIILINLQFQ